MLLIPCPSCGSRAESEFRCAGEVYSPRPAPDSLTDEQWIDYLCYRNNRPEIIEEHWCHEKGCGMWFRLRRDTVTHKLTVAE